MTLRTLSLVLTVRTTPTIVISCIAMMFLVASFCSMPSVVSGTSDIFDVMDIVCLELIPDLPFYTLEKSKDCDKPSTEELATNLLDSEWKNYNSTICKISVEYPANFTIIEKQNRFDQRLLFQIVNDEPRVNFMVNCAESKQIFPVVLASYVEELKYELVGYDEFLIEDTNMSKWKMDNKTTGSFVYGTTNANTYITYAIETLYTYHDKKDILISYMSKAEDFDIPKMQDLQKRMIDSIRFYN